MDSEEIHTSFGASVQSCISYGLFVFFSFVCDYLWSQNNNNNKQQTNIDSIFIQLFQQFYKIHGIVIIEMVNE